MDNRPIGFLDSGVGGLSVVKELRRQLPHEEVIYIGDSARAPYGPRTAEEVRQFTWDLVDFLMEQDVKMIIIACNTATAVAWEEIKETLKIPVLGVILPGASAAIKATHGGKIGVIATEMTVASDIYRQKIQALDPKAEVISQSCPPFVPLVEKNEIQSSLAKKVVYEQLKDFRGKISTLILGCTHYPLLRPIIQNALGPDVTLIDSGAECVRDISVLLNYFELNRDRLADGQKNRFYTTGSVATFTNLAKNWLKEDVAVEHVDL